MRGIYRLLGMATSVVFMLGLMVLPVAAQSSHDGQHCPAHEASYAAPYGKHGTSGDMTVDGVTVSWSGASVSIHNGNVREATVIWCAKGGAGFDGGTDPIASQSIGQQTTVLAANGAFSDSYGTGISYFMLYSVSFEGEEPGDEEQEPQLRRARRAPQALPGGLHGGPSPSGRWRNAHLRPGVAGQRGMPAAVVRPNLHVHEAPGVGQSVDRDRAAREGSRGAGDPPAGRHGRSGGDG
jgi:hypothetical protein